MADREPFAILASDNEAVKSEVERLRDANWSVQHGFALPESPWDLRDDARVCAGTIDEATAATALLAAVRGVSLVVVLRLEGEAQALFCNDLARIAPVRHATADAASDELPLDDVQRRLLELLGDGRTTSEAAAELFLSLRTAERKLAAARHALGVASTAEAIALARRAPIPAKGYQQ